LTAPGEDGLGLTLAFVPVVPVGPGDTPEGGSYLVRKSLRISEVSAEPRTVVRQDGWKWTVE